MPPPGHSAGALARAGWMVRRLRLMSPREVMLRGQRFLRNRAWRSFPPPSDADGAPAAVAWFVDLQDQARLRTALRGEFHWNENAATDYLHHRFTFFRLDRADFGPRIRWNHDYANGVSAPLEFGPDMDYRNAERCGDIKYVWEHNRHHHLVELAKAFYLTGKEEYADEVRAQVESWVEQCPYLKGVHWASSLESAIRVINWCFAYQFLRAGGSDYARRHPEFMRRWTRSVYQHLVFISRNFSRHSSANNHLIGEACGLFVGALCFTFPESETWVRAGKGILEEEALRQIWPDGVCKEQAVSYQAFVFDFLMIAALLGQRNNRGFSAAYRERLEKMAEFVHTLIDASGDVPKIGDEDDGYVVVLSHDPGFKLFRSLLATAAVVFGRGDFARAAGRYDEKSFWLLGFQEFQLLTGGDRERAPGLSFNDGGYYLLKGESSTMIVDCGPLGYLSLAAHGHADALGVLLAYKDRWFLTDPGTYAYHTGREWREYFRGTGAHNTVRIDGADQSVIGGNFMWLRKAVSHLLRHDACSLAGWHDGYMRLPDPVRHEREIVYDATQRTYRLTDRIGCAGTHTVELLFHFPPECSLTNEGEAFTLTSGPAAIVLRPDDRLQDRAVLRGSLSPRGGWYSPGYDRMVPSTTLRLAMTISGATELVTLLSLR